MAKIDIGISVRFNKIDDSTKCLVLLLYIATLTWMHTYVCILHMCTYLIIVMEHRRFTIYMTYWICFESVQK